VKAFELETARAALILPGTPHGIGDSGEESCCVEVRAPVDGRILMIIQESESLVTGGAPLLEIGDPRTLEIVVDLLSSDAVKVREEGAVLIEEWGGAPLQGRVRRIEPYGFTKTSALGIDEQRVNVIVDLADPPEAWQRLGHGYRVEVRIVIWEAAAVLKLPVSALFRDGDAWTVFVEAEGVAQKRRVEIGQRNSLAAEVLGGLDEGDRVVLYPSDRVSNGIGIVQRNPEGT
jgi:HlyD family secretion protein